MTREEARKWFEEHIPTKIMPVAQRAYELALEGITPVSYTHLDVYKRQAIEIHCSEISFGETKKAREGNSGCTDGQGAYRPQATAPPQPVAPAFDLPPDGTGYGDVLPCDDTDVPF